MGKFRLVIATLILCSCGPNNSEVSPTASYTPQPIELFQQSYPMQCSNRLPSTPICIRTMGMTIESYMSASQLRASFEACRTDVENFVAAVKFQAECYEKSLENYVEEALSQINDRVACEKLEISKIENGSDGNTCPTIQIPAIPDMLNKDDYNYISGIDQVSITKFACDRITDANDIEMRRLCVDELMNGFPMDAQTYYEEQLEYFYDGGRVYPKREGVKKYINKVIEEFNCKASGQTFCF